MQILRRFYFHIWKSKVKFSIEIVNTYISSTKLWNWNYNTVSNSYKIIWNNPLWLLKIGPTTIYMIMLMSKIMIEEVYDDPIWWWWEKYYTYTLDLKCLPPHLLTLRWNVSHPQHLLLQCKNIKMSQNLRLDLPWQIDFDDAQLPFIFPYQDYQEMEQIIP